MTGGIAVVILLVLSIANYFAGKRRVLYPPFIYTTIWCLDCGIFLGGWVPCDDVHAMTWVVICSGAVVFSLGGWFGSLTAFGSAPNSNPHHIDSKSSSFGIYLLVGICAVGVPLMFKDVMSHGGLALARQAYVDVANSGQSEGFLLSNLPIFSIAVVLICILESRSKLLWVAMPLSIAATILTGGRSYLLLLFAASLSAHLLKNNKDTLSKLARFAIPAILFLAVFIGLVFLQKDVSGFESGGAVVLMFVLAYFVVPLPALDHVLRNPVNYNHSVHHSFGFLAKLARIVGFDVDVPLMHDKFINVPWPTNTYTIYKFYITDFGFIGMFVTVFLIAFIQTAIYRQARLRGGLFVFLSSLLVYPTVLSIFDDLYLGGGLVQIVKAMLIAGAYFGILTRLRLVFNFEHGLREART